jgi:hypothetical protein
MSKRHRTYAQGKCAPTKRKAAVAKIQFVEPICMECDRRAYMVTGLLAYPHKPEWSKRIFWKCECGALASCHPGTAIAAARPASGATRYARKMAHDAFDAIWEAKAGIGSLASSRARKNAYRWLAEQMGLEVVHIGWLGREDCERVVRICRARARVAA